MKKILLSLMTTICFFAIVTTAKAQCDLAVNNFTITQFGGSVYDAGTNTCTSTFNVAFDITTNSGFKYLYLASWLSADYPSPSIFNCANNNTPNQSPGNVTQLGTSISQVGTSVVDIGFNNLDPSSFTLNNVVDITSFLAATPNYPNNDNNAGQFVALNTASSATVERIASNVLHFEIDGIVVVTSGACQPLIVTTDIWGTNATGSQLGTSKSKIGAQCYVCGLSQSFNDPTLALLPLCGNPRQYSFSITTGQSAATVYSYSVYLHDPTVADADHTTDVLLTSGNITLSTNGADAYPTTYNSGTLTIAQSPYCCIAPWSEWSYRLDVTSPSFSNTRSTGNIETPCASLPIKLKSFNAKRSSRTVVDLIWETEIEENNLGFFVDRKLANGSWQEMTFVATKAFKGNSNTPLAYNLSDLNDSKGISLYRLRQVDIDGQQAYSVIRSVRGEGQKSSVIVYPNPSGDGKVNVIFDDVKGIRDVSVNDVSGRLIKQMKGVTSNNIQIDNLNAGFYTVRILNTETGEQVVEKFVVNKR